MTVCAGNVGDQIDLVQGWPAQAEVPPVAAQRQQHGLGEARKGAAVGQPHRTAVQPEAGHIDQSAVEQEQVGAFSNQIRAGVPRLGRVQHRGSRCQMFAAQQGVRGGGEQHHNITAGNGLQVLAGADGNAGADRVRHRCQSG